LGIPKDHVLDALVFSSPDHAHQAVYVAGKTVAQRADPEMTRAFAQTMRVLWET
jgi:hypothetical protein